MGRLRDEEQAARAALDEALAALGEITSESLVRSADLGTTLDFSDGADVFGRTLNLFASLAESRLENVPVSTVQRLTNSASQAAQTFQKITDFDPSAQGNPSQVRDSLIQEVDNQYQQYFELAAPIVAYSVRKGTDFERLETDARARLDEIEHIVAAAQAGSEKTMAEAQSALEQVKQAAAEVGVAQHAVHFQQEAAAHLKTSRWWLGVTAVLALVTAGYGVWCLYNFTNLADTMTTARSVQLGISKLIVFSILYFAVIWAGRTYRAQVHNYVVNKHRQNALSTFETFVKAAGDEDTKNAVLLQATQAIFSPQSSGFVPGDTETAQSPQILEIIRSVTASRGPQQ
jgi:hypothetical protein